MPSFKHPCPACGTFISRDAARCPACGRIDPFVAGRCPDCRAAIEDAAWIACPSCGKPLKDGVAPMPGSAEANLATAAGSAAPAPPAPDPAVAPAAAAPVPAAPDAAPPPAPAACAGCGAALAAGARFCTVCGTIAG